MTRYINDGDHLDVELAMVARDLDLADCKLTHGIAADAPGVEPISVRIQPQASQTLSLIDGLHAFGASCHSSEGLLQRRITIRAADGQPERCLDFSFPEAPISVTTLEELADGMVGTWEGCVETPWVPTYYVTMVFRADGTYSSESTETLDGRAMVALYAGSDADSPAKKYAIVDLQESGLGVGEIDIIFEPDTPSGYQGELQNIRLMGDQLGFDFFNGSYGPMVFQLLRV